MKHLDENIKSAFRAALIQNLYLERHTCADLSQLSLSPAEIAHCAGCYGLGDLEADALWAIYQEARPLGIAKARKAMSLATALEDCELREAQTDDPRNGETPADQKPLTMTRLMERLSEKRNAAADIWEARRVTCAEEGRDVKEDAVAGSANDAIVALEEAIAALKDVAADADWLATDGGQEGW